MGKNKQPDCLIRNPHAGYLSHLKMFCNVSVFSWCEQPQPQMGQQQSRAQALLLPQPHPLRKRQWRVAHTCSQGGSEGFMCNAARSWAQYWGWGTAFPVILWSLLLSCSLSIPQTFSPYSPMPAHLLYSSLRDTTQNPDIFLCLLVCLHTLPPSFSCLPIPVKCHSQLLSGYWVWRLVCLCQLSPKATPSVEGKDLELKKKINRNKMFVNRFFSRCFPISFFHLRVLNAGAPDHHITSLKILQCDKNTWEYYTDCLWMVCNTNLKLWTSSIVLNT